ncbi:MAG: hypothetical protein AB7F74_07230 [Parvibaculaceae bacterium]
MTAAYISLIAGLIVAVVYIIAVWRGLIAAKREMAKHGGALIGEITAVDDRVFRAQETGVLVKSAAGVVLSTIALIALILSPWFWYLVPFLSIGTAISVIVAFATEARTDRASQSRA